MGEKRAEQKQVAKKINMHRNRDGGLAKRARGGLVVGQLVSAYVCVQGAQALSKIDYSP